MASKSNHLMPHPSIHVQHPQVFENLHTKISSTSTPHQQQWMLLPSEGTSNTTGSMGKSCRWSKSSSGVQFAPVLREVSHTVKVMYSSYCSLVPRLSQPGNEATPIPGNHTGISLDKMQKFESVFKVDYQEYEKMILHNEKDLTSWSTT